VVFRFWAAFRRGILGEVADVTRILSAIEQGDPHAAEQLLPLVYDELRKLAAQRLVQEKTGQTLQATALVHDAYVRLVDVEKAQHWNSRGHFFAAAAEAMRRILIENARRKGRQKRGGAGWQRVDLDSEDLVSQTTPDELLCFDDAVAALTAEEPEAGQLVKLRYFAGLSIDEAADLMHISRTTAKRYWAFARAWLLAEIDDAEAGRKS
jgi:RNA polymerase sigma factor (TIGR02999 family)